MKRGTLSLCLYAACVASATLCARAVNNNPYQVIIDRNPFQLQPIPPPPPPPPPPGPETNAAPPMEIKLTGITTLLGAPKVFLQLLNPQTKKPEFPPALLVGEKQGDIEILAIDPDAGTVKIRQGDAETTLDFDKNGIKPAAVAAAPPVPGMVPLGTPPPPPGVTAAPSASGRGAIVAGNTAFANPAPNPGANVPPRPLRSEAYNNVIVTGQGGSPTPSMPAPTAAPTLSREDIEARIEAQRQILLQKEQSGQIAPGMSPARILPPTRFTPPSMQPQPRQAQ